MLIEGKRLDNINPLTAGYRIFCTHATYVPTYCATIFFAKAFGFGRFEHLSNNRPNRFVRHSAFQAQAVTRLISASVERGERGLRKLFTVLAHQPFGGLHASTLA